MGAYLENSRNALLDEFHERRRAAEKRRMRWENNYGNVGCYPDLVDTVRMFDAIISAIARTTGEG